jgi:hypothetical protein
MRVFLLPFTNLSRAIFKIFFLKQYVSSHNILLCKSIVYFFVTRRMITQLKNIKQLYLFRNSGIKPRFLPDVNRIFIATCVGIFS